MSLIYSNSLYASIHSEIYEISLDSSPIYIELFHNTDDDTLLLLMINDPTDLRVSELRLDNLNDKNWLIQK